ncbi:uncharacterized protein [Physcomitrium patens]|uniref:CRAL-TRIO domain-containing protein n=1 Tax=Physcomitrium patens TaxID=3218 RepID=A0A2K1KGM0_PHYPA|nr:ganglioside-induced differentiation-associated protein 2-like isoform X1 [Physcomitrium patens]PNR52918.1 hypothetical protein PHYPA_009293 [Physcomitrium patens]|eukprot:XP_024378983.1 ganglioside-induced differentiation-associated protein 2-like isoform X1 [Physcomitrella patens]
MSFASLATYNAMSLVFSEDLEPLQILDLQGVDVLGRQVVRIVGKHLPAPAIDVEKLKVFVLHKLHHELKPGPYVVVYFHTAVQRNDNSPGLWALRDLYEILPKQLKHGLQAVYVVHPGLRFRLFLGTLGRFFLSEGFYSKLVYISRLEFLTEHVRESQVEIPEFVIDHDRELETRPLMDYGVEVDLTQNNSMPVGEYPRSPYR